MMNPTPQLASRARLARRRLAPALAIMLAVLGPACADKVLTPHASLSGSPKLLLQVVATGIPQSQLAANTPRYLFGVVAYANAKDTIPLGFTSAPITGATQQLSIPADLTQCLADPTRTGSHEACTILIGIAITDSVRFNGDSTNSQNGSGDPFDNSYDYAIIGPFDAAPGHAPAIRA